MDYQNSAFINQQPTKNGKTKKIIWLVGTSLLFFIQPIYLKNQPPECLFFICDPSAYIIGIIDFVWVLTSLLFFIPQFKSAGVIKFKNGRVILIMAVSLLLFRFAIPVINYPYGIFKHFMRPQLFITVPIPDSVIQAGEKYELRWESKHIGINEPLLIFYEEPWADGSGGVSIENLGTARNTGKYEFSLNPGKIKEGRYYISIISIRRGQNFFSSDYDAYARVIINVINPK